MACAPTRDGRVKTPADTGKSNESQLPADREICQLLANTIDENQLKRWTKEASKVQRDYKNIVKHKGKLERLK